MATNQPAPQSLLWKDSKDIYPKAEEIAIALQDKGKEKATKKKGGDGKRRIGEAKLLC